MTELEEVALSGGVAGQSAAEPEDKDALSTFLNVVRRSKGCGKLADTLEQSEVRPANGTFYGVKSTDFQGS